MPGVAYSYSDEQLRVVANLAQHYDAWLEAERDAAALPYGMHWKTATGREYLYQTIDRRGNASSLGPRSVETEAILDRFRDAKEDAALRTKGARIKLIEDCRLYRSLRLPRIASAAAEILREADRRRLLGTLIMVVGTNAMPAYALEANGPIADAPDTTDNFDLAWIAGETEASVDMPLWAMLHAVDPTYTVNTEKPFQARNRKAYEVELLVAPSRQAGLYRRDRPKPVALPEQEWLLGGRPVNHVVIGQDGSPARIVAPDPRLFALQKLWMADQEKRNPIKRPEDLRQGIALLNAVESAMPHYPLDEAFEAELPDELRQGYNRWKAQRPEPVRPRW